ncbi:hypothetical protein [Nocardia asteroides]|uniref:hypothetical protein n=1 Tax=Nocardia asteroides TaxID=1824 RepID=UPI001E2F4389|nr:hypothetical protein [Nocardia asteroides]UGT64185.1 hypothetical protein LTT61_13190 [Nocardia asteroides]
MPKPSAIVEYDDRWIINPLRNRAFTGIDVDAAATVLRFDSGFVLRTSAGAELSARSIADGAVDRHPLDFWSQEDAARNLSSTVVSPVFFKKGSLRLGFANGWSLFVSPTKPEVPAELWHEERLVWSRAGLPDDLPFPVVQIDRWTGQEITAPPWPERPAELDLSSSDDING